jgi:hypothetical protein
MGVLFAHGFNVPRMLAAGLVGAGVALAVAFGRLYRARRGQANSGPAGDSASLTLGMVGVLLLCLALVFGGIFWWTAVK